MTPSFYKPRPSSRIKCLSALTLVLMAGGCANQPPASSVGQPAVFTALHLQAAESSYGADHSGVGVPADLQRYFRSTPDSYNKEKLRIDVMLDNIQRRRALAQSVISRLDVQLKLLANAAAADKVASAKDATQSGLVKPNKDTPAAGSSGSADATANAGAGGAASASGTTKPNDATNDQTKKDDPNARLAAAMEAVKKQLEEATKDVPTDSLFDSLDRASDAYTAYMLKSLRLYGVDSRVIPPGPLYNVLRAQEKALVAEGVAQNRTVIPIALGNVEAFRASLRAQALASQLSSPAETAVASVETKVSAVGGAAASTTSAAAAVESNTTPVVPRLFRNPSPVVTGPRPGTFTASSAASISLDRFDAFDSSTTFSDAQWKAMSADERKKAIESWERVSSERIKAAADTDAKRFEAVKANATAVAALKELEASDRAHEERMSRLPATLKKEQDAAVEASISKIADDLAAAVKSTDGALESARAEYLTAIKDYNDSVEQARKAAVDSQAASGQRLIMLLLQSHVAPGTKANMMVGVRARIVGFKQAGQDQVVTGGAANLPINVVRVHPTRNYDVEDQVFAEQLSEQAALNVAGKITDDMEATFARDLASEAAERRRFLSRIPKVCSFADAANAEFGWNFFPSNLVVSKRSVLERAGGLVASQLATAYRVDAYLEGGARDCAVFLVLPTDVESITLEVEHVTASLEIGDEHRYTVYPDASRSLSNSTVNHSRMVVTLPPFDTREWASMLGRLAAPAPIHAVQGEDAAASKAKGKE